MPLVLYAFHGPEAYEQEVDMLKYRRGVEGTLYCLLLRNQQGKRSCRLEES